ncbi:MAG: hypothetical protein JRD88_07690 [Deltaproteobacteria bacterium]|nr:hypothetical protein [Deltaproteobacteria bacterium]
MASFDVDAPNINDVWGGNPLISRERFGAYSQLLMPQSTTGRYRETFD